MGQSDLTPPQRRRLRLPDFDYRDAGAYFVTVCSHRRALTFVDEQVRGIIKGIWDEIPVHFAHVRLDAFVVMPNHVHGVVFIASGGRGSASPLPEPDGQATKRSANPGGPAPGSLGAMVGSFKSAAARRINSLLRTPGAQVWQRNYYEHVIRDEEKLNVIRRYVQENPDRWAEDRYNPGCQVKRKIDE